MNASFQTTTHNPSLEQWSAYQSAYDYFNVVLFDGRLPRCILNFSRHANCYGFFAPARWSRGEKVTHEISLNPDEFNRPIDSTMATLVHEMCHLADFEAGTASTRGYHGKSWAAIMESVGLIPSDTAAPSGKKTGFKVSHYVETNGAFEKAFRKMPPEYLIPWQAAPIGSGSSRRGATGTEEGDNEGAEPKPKAKSKVKFSCPGCNANAWGKPSLKLICGDCEETMQSEEAV